MSNSPQQQAFIDATVRTDDNIGLIACAGSGKTTTGVAAEDALTMDGKLRPEQILNVAFNKKNAQEFQGRMPQGTTNKTMNAVGHGAWQRKVGRTRLTVDESKTWNIIDDLNMSFKHPDLAKLVSIAKSAGLRADKSPWGHAGVIPNSEDGWLGLIDHFNIEAGPDEVGGVEDMIDCARKILQRSVDRAFQGYIDYDDQVYMTTFFAPECLQKFPLVFVDEAQDLSTLQHMMVSYMVKDRLLFAGDPHQAIYGFRGADSSSMNSLQDRFGSVMMPLTHSFRCPRTVVREARKWVNHIEPTPEAPEGQVLFHESSPWGPRTELDLTQGDMILCRNTKPLVSAAMRLIQQGVGVEILGKDIGKNLVNFARKLKKAPNDARQMLVMLSRWVDAECQRLYARHADSKAELLQDKLETIEVIVEDLAAGATVDDLCRAIETLFSNPAALVKLSTIHKAKGLEWRRVFLLDPHLIGARKPKQAWMREAEQNLAYVAVTRAKSTLAYVSSEGLSKKKETMTLDSLGDI